MPELPDLTVVAEAFDAALRGRPIASVEAPGPLAVRGTPAELEALVGQTVTEIRQRGKFLMIDLDRDAIVVNPMLTGRFQLAGPGVKQPSKTAVVLAFGPAALARALQARGVDEGRVVDAGAGRGTRDPLPRPDPDGQGLLAAGGVERSVPGLGPGEIGPDVDDPGLSLDAWREAIRRHPGELKNLLRNQSFVAGIGNAYSDEILHAAKLLPFRKRSTLAGEEIDALYAADALDGDGRDRDPAPARATDVRDAGPRLPRGPHEGRSGLPALRDPDHRGQGGRLRDVVLPGLPALTRSGQLELLADPELGAGRPGPLSSARSCHVVPNSPAMPESVSPLWTV